MQELAAISRSVVTLADGGGAAATHPRCGGHEAGERLVHLIGTQSNRGQGGQGGLDGRRGHVAVSGRGRRGTCGMPRPSQHPCERPVEDLRRRAGCRSPLFQWVASVGAHQFRASPMRWLELECSVCAQRAQASLVSVGGRSTGIVRTAMHVCFPSVGRWGDPRRGVYAIRELEGRACWSVFRRSVSRPCMRLWDLGALSMRDCGAPPPSICRRRWHEGEAAELGGGFAKEGSV